MKLPELARLLQLSSQALPIGGYSHSQGMESAVDQQIVVDEASALQWIGQVLDYSLATFELPLLMALAAAWQDSGAAVAALNDEFLAARESAELRAATVQMGYSLRALLAVLPAIPAGLLGQLESLREPSLPCVWSAAATAWHIAPRESALAYAWSWAENQVLAAIKTLPLGQSAGQRLLLQLGARIAAVLDAPDSGVERGSGGAAGSRALASCGSRGSLSNFAPALAILCSQHESQYSRLFRS